MKALRDSTCLKGFLFPVMVALAISLCCFQFAGFAEEEGAVFEDFSDDPIIITPPAPPPVEEFTLSNRFYIGIGGFYGFFSGDAGDVTMTAWDYWYVDSYQCSISADTKDGGGVSVKAGYFLSEHFALEAIFQYHFGYDIEGDTAFRRSFLDAFDDVSANMKGELEGFDISLNSKIFFTRGTFRPYCVGGLGYMDFKRKWDGEARVDTTFTSGSLDGWRFWRIEPYSGQSDSLSGLFARIGAGCDFFFADNFGLELEVAYNFGFGDVKDIQTVGIGLNALVVF